MAKVPTLLDRAKAAAGSAEVSATERFDEQKKKRAVNQAEEEMQLKPGDPDARRGLMAAMTLDECYGSYRKALRALKATVDEEFAADPSTTTASMQGSIEASLKILKG